MNKRFLIFGFILLLSTAPVFLFAEQITTVGIIDVNKVAQVFFRESQVVRELEEMAMRIQEEIDNITQEIYDLEERKLNAESIGDRQMALQLDTEIFERTNYLRDYHRIKTGQLEEKKKNLTESETFLTEMVSAMEFVAESEGYTVIVRSSDPNLMWWSKEVDITELVIQRLLSTSN